MRFIIEAEEESGQLPTEQQSGSFATILADTAPDDFQREWEKLTTGGYRPTDADADSNAFNPTTAAQYFHVSRDKARPTVKQRYELLSQWLESRYGSALSRT